MKRKKSPELPLQYIHSISLRVQPDRWASLVSLCHPAQAAGPALDASTCFPHERTLGKGVVGGVLILCSFLRLIIHSTASSCYRRPALHPCSSHWGLTLKKKNTSDGHLPGGRKGALWPFLHCSSYFSLLPIPHKKMLKIVMWNYKPTNLVTNEQPGLKLSSLFLKMEVLTCN